MEAVIIADVLRRAGLQVSIAAICKGSVQCSRDVTIVPDCCLEDLDSRELDAIVLPGGMGGTEAFMAHMPLLEILRAHVSAGKLTCAICAAPLALQAAGLVAGKRITCHPAVKDRVTNAEYTGRRVEKDGNILTSQGPGTAFEFALEIVALVKGPDSAENVRDGLVL